MRRDGEMSGGGGGKARRRLQDLEALGDAGLKEAWAKAHGAPAPAALPARLLRLALAHHVQVGTLGGLAPALERRLARITDGADRSDTARPVPIKIKPGATLLRDWGGRRWRSLSAIAREITGTSRNGPAFFGLRGGATPGAA